MKLFISVLLLFYASSAGAQTAAFISKEKLYPALKGYSAKQASLDTLKVKLYREVRQEEQGLQKKYQAIINPYAPGQNETLEELQTRMSKPDTERLKLLQEEQKLHESRIISYNNQITDQYNRDLKAYVETANKEIEVYARKNKIDMVWYLEDIKMALPYYNNAKNITAVIADRVNKMFP
ncbi:OmpH family outer membrane protein [uncultured Chryseobacterium sp.]|uniref:OmpH family outer membrane protein n=1 Tax=uncultured Chryseobacterium sp. TaxID=259322 RepID=UPI0025FC30CF|nr:OmpH family outer membrane protein [uncultured Chryseobacterium sp.]